MQLTVQGKQMDLGDALRAHVSEKLEDINAKYFNRAIDATVTFAKEGHSFIRNHISIRIGKDIMVMADAVDADPYAAFDHAAVKVAKQMRRYKNRLRNHHQRTDEVVAFQARDYVIESGSADGEAHPAAEDDHTPVVIAEMATTIQTMAVADAVMRLDLSGLPALLFRNASHDGLNMVYRRSDGNIGWVDPEGAETVRLQPPAKAKAQSGR